jgi:serine protease Do
VTQVAQRGATQEPRSRLPEARRFSAAFADVAAEVTPAVVRIQTERSAGEMSRSLQERMRDLFDRLPEDHPDLPPHPSLAGGTGVLVSGDGLILTNHHVIAGATRIAVTLADKRTFPARVVGSDPTTDIAIIAIEGADLPAARLGDSDDVRVGEWVIAIGNPAFHRASTLDFTVTSGIVSAKGRPLDVIREELSRSGSRSVAPFAIEDFIQTDAAINPGNSGGPLVDLNGEVIGINTAIASANGFNQGYGFAVPINMAKRVMADLLEYGKVRRPLLGISIQDVEPEDAQAYGLPRIAGVLVEDFPPNSPAEKAGLRRHDVIIALAGEPVERLGQFQSLVASRRPGEVVDVEVVRFGQTHRYAVRLMEADLGAPRVVRTSPERPSEADLGLELVELTPAMARDRNFSRQAGALIAGVRPHSAAMRRGVDRGLVIREINRAEVESAAQAERILRSLQSGTVVSLLLEDARGATIIRNVRVP